MRHRASPAETRRQGKRYGRIRTGALEHEIHVVVAVVRQRAIRATNPLRMVEAFRRRERGPTDDRPSPVHDTSLLEGFDRCRRQATDVARTSEYHDRITDSSILWTHLRPAHSLGREYLNALVIEDAERSSQLSSEGPHP